MSGRGLPRDCRAVTKDGGDCNAPTRLRLVHEDFDDIVSVCGVHLAQVLKHLEESDPGWKVIERRPVAKPAT